jgi:putative transposase
MARRRPGRTGAASNAVYLTPYLFTQVEVAPVLSLAARRRLKWFEYYESCGRNAALVCRHFDISRATFYRWKARYNRFDLASLEDKSRAPTKRRTPTTPASIVDAVLAARDRNPEWSKHKISFVLARDSAITVSASTVGRILRRYGRVDAKRSNARRRAAKQAWRKRRPKEYCARQPGALLQVDTKHVWTAGTRRYHFVAIDLATRLKVCWASSSGSSRQAAAFLDVALSRLPFAVLAIQTDNGSEYAGEFHAACQQKGIAHFFNHPRNPKGNAFVERAIRTDQDEFYRLVEDLGGIEEHNDLLVAWDRFYNEIRPHQSLGYSTPMAYYRSIEGLSCPTPTPDQ